MVLHNVSGRNDLITTLIGLTCFRLRWHEGDLIVQGRGSNDEPRELTEGEEKAVAKIAEVLPVLPAIVSSSLAMAERANEIRNAENLVIAKAILRGAPQRPYSAADALLVACDRAAAASNPLATDLVERKRRALDAAIWSLFALALVEAEADGQVTK